jgi:hypothetical protein
MPLGQLVKRMLKIERTTLRVRLSVGTSGLAINSTAELVVVRQRRTAARVHRKAGFIIGIQSFAFRKRVGKRLREL